MKNILLVCFLAIIIAVGGAVIFFKKTSPKPETSSGDTTGWKSYTDPAGFSLKYPPDVIINGDSKNGVQYNLSISSEPVNEIQDQPIIGGKDEAIKDKDALAEGKIIGDGFASEVQLFKLGQMNSKSSTTLSQFEICSVMFNKRLTFYPNNYRVVIGFSGNKDLIEAEMPEYFKIDTANCGDQKVWNLDKTEAFLLALKNHQGSTSAQKWYDTFNGIIKSITLNP